MLKKSLSRYAFYAFQYEKSQPGRSQYGVGIHYNTYYHTKVVLFCLFFYYLCNPMMRIEHIRSAIAVLLLSVVLPITLVLPFHHHEAEQSTADSCELCMNHQPHPGHLESASHLDDCLICHLLGVSYLREESVGTPSKPSCSVRLVAGEPGPVICVQGQSLSSRAPPFSFC